jgi:hypothetical protein
MTTTITPRTAAGSARVCGLAATTGAAAGTVYGL